MFPGSQLRAKMCVSSVFLCKSFNITRSLNGHRRLSVMMSVHSQKVQTDVKTKPMDKAAKESTSFVMNAFLGKFVGTQVFPFHDLLTQDQKETTQMLVDSTERFFKEVNDPYKNEELGKIEDSTMEELKNLGGYGLQVPTEFGGLGLNNTQYARICELTGINDVGFGITTGAHQSIGYKGILLVGTKDQKEKYLPICASGEKLAAFALTEPSSGSDAGSIKSRAVLSEDGSYYTLNGSKLWISNGGIAEIFTVFAQTSVPDDKGESRDKVTAFIVERSFGGLTSGPPEDKLGIRASNTAEVYFDDVKIPAENVLGGVGNGFKVAMNILNNGRFSMAAGLCGAQKVAMEKAIEFAKNRTQFGRKIETYGVIQEKLARMALRHYVTECLAFAVSTNMDAGFKDYHLEAAISKIFASEATWYTVDEAIQVLGGMGYMKQAGLEKMLRDVRIFRIFEGTNDILRLFVALTGLQYAGGHLKELQNALKRPLANFGAILEEGTNRAKKAFGMPQGQTIEGLHPSLIESGVSLIRCVEAFGNASENLLIKHGKNIVEQQFILTRLAEAAIDIYTSATVLARVSRALDLGGPSGEHELKIARVWIKEASNRVDFNLKATGSTVTSNTINDLRDISKDLCENDGVVASRPLGF